MPGGDVHGLGVVDDPDLAGTRLRSDVVLGAARRAVHAGLGGAVDAGAVPAGRLRPAGRVVLVSPVGGGLCPGRLVLGGVAAPDGRVVVRVGARHADPAGGGRLGGGDA
ncbi:hypothetical protein DKL51_17635, partial [Micromonospora globispora]